MKELQSDTRDGRPRLNPIWLMTHSGARGSIDQVRQLAGMRGLMAKPSGRIIETPIKANFREGLTVLEYFSSTHGARKGLADTALKTADSGYLTRKLADVAQNVIVAEPDCETLNSVEKEVWYSGGEVDRPLADAVVGRISAQNIVDPLTDKYVVKVGEVITASSASKIEELGIDRLRVRSPLTCESPFGCCAMCYGVDRSSGKLVEEGMAVGIIAAQSIGEPGTQLTMRTFHIGGTAHRAVLQSEHRAGQDGVVKYHGIRAVSVKDSEGEHAISLKRNGEILVLDSKGRELERFGVPLGATLLMKDEAKVKAGELVCKWDPHMAPILAEDEGVARYADIVEGETMRIEEDRAGFKRRLVIEHKGERHPRVIIKTGEDYKLPNMEALRAALVDRIQPKPKFNKKRLSSDTDIGPLGRFVNAAYEEFTSGVDWWPSYDDDNFKSSAVANEKQYGLLAFRRRSGTAKTVDFIQIAGSKTTPLREEIKRAYTSAGRDVNQFAENIKTHLEKERGESVSGKEVEEYIKEHYEFAVFPLALEEAGKILEFHYIPARTYVEIEEGDTVVPGTILARRPREMMGTQDITAGLPRVTELFEARKPKEPAVMSEIDGVVELSQEKKRGKMTIIVRNPETGIEKEHYVPHDRHLRVHTGDQVKAGDMLTDGPLVPHDMLRIAGEAELQKYLLREIQNVYRCAPVTIDDKHIEAILSRMLRKVRVDRPGDTSFLPGEVVDKFRFRAENQRISRMVKVVDPGDTEFEEGQLVLKNEFEEAAAIAEQGSGKAPTKRRPKPATAKTMLLGITKASLQSESFLSAASFQETTKVLTEAGLAGKVDPLLGLKENVVLGHLIPAGTGFKPYLEATVRLHAEPPVAAEAPAAEEQAPIGLGSEVRQRLSEA